MDDEETARIWGFVPDPWRLVDMRREMFAPSHATKSAARLAVKTSEVQQATGWLLLTHFGILLGSFGSILSGKVFWLSWSIFILEALSKLGRSYIHSLCFRNVPCAYVPSHHKYVAFAFGLYAQLGAAVAEACLYVPSWIQFIRQYRQFQIYIAHGCGSGCSNVDLISRQRLDEVLLAACVITLLHFFLGMVATTCLLRAVVIRPQEKLACLTWWVHASRHGQMSVAAGTGQPDICGLPVHWLASVTSLRKFLEESMQADASSLAPAAAAAAHMKYLAVPSSVHDNRKYIQLMAMRGLLSLVRQQQQLGAHNQILESIGFDHLMKVLTEGSSRECIGLAAAIIGIWASTLDNNIKLRKLYSFSKAIYPLKWLLIVTGVEEAECAERVLGGLLNIALLPDEYNVMEELLHSDHELMGKCTLPMLTDFLIQQAKAGPTCKVRVLAVSLLARLSTKSPTVRRIIREGQQELMFAALVERGQTLELRAVAAGLLWELAYSIKPKKALGSSDHILLMKCVTALVKSLAEIVGQVLHPDQYGAQYLARNAAGALASFAYKNKVAKDIITGLADAIPSLVRMLHEDHKDTDAQVQACRVLWILADNYPHNQARIAAAGAMPRLAGLLSANPGPREDVLLQALWAISRLAFKCRANQEAMAPPKEHRIIPFLVKLLNFKGQEGGASMLAEAVCEKAALALRDLAHGNEENQKTIATQDGALEGLIDLLTRSHEMKRRNRVCAFASSAVQLLAESINHNSNLLPGLQAARTRLEDVMRVPPPLPKDVQNAVQAALDALNLH